MDPAQIIELLKQHLPSVLHTRPVALAYLYGSVAAGQATPLSDVDIALVLDAGVTLDAYERLMMELEIQGELERQCGLQNLDVRTIDNAPIAVQGRVVTEGRLVYCRDDNQRVDYEVRTRKLYFDFQPVLAAMQDAYFARLEADLREKALL